jgi:hypothetical protein
MLIGLTGKARSGKDTVADILKKSDKRWDSVSFADPIREGVAAMFGWNNRHLHGELKEVVDPLVGVSPREAMQKLGTEWGRGMIKETLWADLAKHRVNYLLNVNRNVVVSDIRFDNEAQLIHDLDGIIIRIERDNLPTVREHASEQGVSDDLVHYVLKNNSSLTQLEEQVLKLIGLRRPIIT